MSKASGSISAAATALALLLLAAPAGAVIDGTSDTANKYANHCADVLFEEGDDGFGPGRPEDLLRPGGRRALRGGEYDVSADKRPRAMSLEEAQAILAALVLMAGERKGNAAFALADLCQSLLQARVFVKTSSQPGSDEPARIERAGSDDLRISQLAGLGCCSSRTRKAATRSLTPRMMAKAATHATSRIALRP
jgi:hypothetical protein